MSGVILVAGGAGYIGSHTCLRLADRGYRPVVYDNLSNGHRSFVQWGPLEVGDIRDAARLDAVFAKHRPIAVIHFAGLIEVGRSVSDPGAFFDENTGGAITLIQAARRAGVEVMVFSSTCATFGAPVALPMAEDHPQAPLSPYGRSKLMVEQALADYGRCTAFRSTIMRYFNAAGADLQGRIGERHEPETHLIPIAMEVAQGRREKLTIFGADYDTRDGTAVRDYIHVTDLADAHVLALEQLLRGASGDIFNLGGGKGVTVREAAAAVERISGRRVALRTAPRRAGDAAVLVADITRAKTKLGWRPRFSLDQIIETAWRWQMSLGGDVLAEDARSDASAEALRP